MSNKVRLIPTNLAWVMKPLILLKDKLYSLVWFWNVETQISISPAAKDDRKFYRTIRNLLFLSGSESHQKVEDCWRLHAVSLSFIGCRVIKYPTRFQIWSGGPYQKDTSCQCLWRQSEISALITEFNSFLLICGVNIHAVNVIRSA